MLAGLLLAAALAPRHDLHVRLEPDAHRLEVRDVVELPAGEHVFTLHEGLEPTTATKGVRLASFLEEGIVDSVGVLELVSFIEENLKVKVGDQEIIPDNFDSVTKLAAYIRRKTQ